MTIEEKLQAQLNHSNRPKMDDKHVKFYVEVHHHELPYVDLDVFEDHIDNVLSKYEITDAELLYEDRRKTINRDRKFHELIPTLQLIPH